MVLVRLPRDGLDEQAEQVEAGVVVGVARARLEVEREVGHQSEDLLGGTVLADALPVARGQGVVADAGLVGEGVPDG